MVVKKSTKRTCITCTAKGINKDETPLWSKKDGLYSMLPKVINCEDTYNPNKQELKEETPEIVGTKVEIPLEIQESNRWVFYWAAESGADLDGDVVEDPATSYGDESNRGVVKTDNDGNATFVLNCPKLYKEDKQMYPRHVHYTVLTKDDVWSTNIGTLEIMCRVPFETMEEIVKKKTYLILDALSKESYDEKHIPNSVLCHYETLDGLKKKNKNTIIKKLVTKQLQKFPKLKKYVDNSDSIKEIPIVVYCAHDKCEASSKLADHLYDCGYYNVVEYPGGLEEWFSNKEDDTELFGDALSDEEQEEDTEIKLDKKLKDNEEIIVYDGIEYIHNIEDNEILTLEDMEPVGTYDGEDIEWNSFDEYDEHLKRKGEDPKQDAEEEEEEEDAEEEDAVEEDAAEEEEEEDAVEEEEDAVEEEEEEEDEGKKGKGKLPRETESSSSDEDEDENYFNSKELKNLRNLLNKLGVEFTKTKGGGNLPKNDSIYYGGNDYNTINNNFRGWGFTFR